MSNQPPGPPSCSESTGASRPIVHPQPRSTRRIKLRAIRGVRRRSASRPATRSLARSGRLVSVAVAAVLVTGGGAVFANSGGPSSGSTSNSSSNSQYCPPSSPAAGKPKKPGPAKCGHGDEKGEKDGKKH